MSSEPVLRSFQPENYPALAAFLTALHPGSPRDEASMRHFDAERLTSEHHARTLAWSGPELAGPEVTGMVETERSRNFTRPGWYGLHAQAADPELRRRLLDLGLEKLRLLSPTVLYTTVSESWPDYGWLTAQGWRDHERMWISTLDLSTFDPEAFGARLHRSRAAGVEIRPLSELGWDGSEAMQRRVYKLTTGLLGDVPSTDPVIPWPFEVWRERILNHPDFTPDGPLIAVAGGEWVGLTELYRPQRETPGLLHQGLTGVRREWRGKGVAWALKLTAAARMKARGWKAAQTGNHTVNREMLGINEAMGFVRGPARVVLVRDWTQISPDIPPSGG